MTQHGSTSAGTPPAEVRAANIGARAVIAAAVIAVGATIVGAVVGGQFTAAAAATQADGQTQSAGAELKANKERDDKSFIREQLQTAAAKLIDDSKVANRKEHDLADMLASPTFTWKNPAYATTKHDLAVQVDLVSADTAKLQLLGYRASDSAAADVLAYHEVIEGDLTSGVLSGNCDLETAPVVRRIFDEYLAGHGIFAIAQRLTDAPVGADRMRGGLILCAACGRRMQGTWNH